MYLTSNFPINILQQCGMFVIINGLTLINLINYILFIFPQLLPNVVFYFSIPSKKQHSIQSPCLLRFLFSEVVPHILLVFDDLENHQKACLDHTSRSFHPQLLNFRAPGPIWRQNITVDNMCWNKVAHFKVNRGQGEGLGEREGGEGKRRVRGRFSPGVRYILQSHSPSDLLPPTGPFLQIIHSQISSSMG